MNLPNRNVLIAVALALCVFVGALIGLAQCGAPVAPPTITVTSTGSVSPPTETATRIPPTVQPSTQTPKPATVTATFTSSVSPPTETPIPPTPEILPTGGGTGGQIGAWPLLILAGIVLLALGFVLHRASKRPLW